MISLLRKNIRLFFAYFMLSLSIVYSAPSEKFKIKSVRFENNVVFTKRQLRRVILSRPSTFLNLSYYYAQVFEDDLKNLELFYHNNGYLEAKITDHQVIKDTTRNEIHIIIKTYEGELTRVEGATIFGNRVFSDEVLLKKIKIRKGEPFKRKKIEDATLAILTLYANNGYLDAEVKPDIQINSRDHLALIDFIVKEKTQSTIGQIKLIGLEKTHQSVVHRELRFGSGEIITYSHLLESQRQLYLTGLFKSVFIRPQSIFSNDSTKRDILIELKENLSGEFNVSIGYESVEKLRGKVELLNTNLSGTARKLGLTFKISSINRGLEASFSEPWTFNIPWRTDMNLTMDYQKEPGYEFNRFGGKLTFGRSFLKRSTATITYRQEEVNLKNVRVSVIPEKLKTNIRSLKFSLIYDTRDNLFNATQGIYFEYSNELAGSFLSGTNSFTRTEARLKYFHRWSYSTIIGTALDVGWMAASGGLKEIPLHERYYAGGPSTLRGFEYQKVGPLDENNVPIGGKFKFVWNLLEIRSVLYKMIGGVLFLDAGNVWLDPRHFKLKNLRLAPGVGLRVNTPIGLGRVDLGFNIDPEIDEPKAKVYISMGQTF